LPLLSTIASTWNRRRKDASRRPLFTCFGFTLTGERGVLQAYNICAYRHWVNMQVAQSASQRFLSITESRREIHVQKRVAGLLFSLGPHLSFSLFLATSSKRGGASVKNPHRYLTAGSLSLFLRDANTHFEHALHHGSLGLGSCDSCSDRSLTAQGFDRGIGDVDVATGELGGPDLPLRLVRHLNAGYVGVPMYSLCSVPMVRLSGPLNSLPADRPGDAAANR
jgi:hypothetical protein